MASQTLIYAGAGWDNDFLQHFKDQYSHFILYDTLPKYPHYQPGQAGYKKSKNAKVFFKTLASVFGQYEQKDNVLYFKNPNVEYHYSCNAELLKDLPPGDIFFRGYEPDSWYKKGFLNNRKLYVACDTRKPVQQYELVHMESDCECDSDSECDSEYSENHSYCDSDD